MYSSARGEALLHRWDSDCTDLTVRAAPGAPILPQCPQLGFPHSDRTAHAGTLGLPPVLPWGQHHTLPETLLATGVL